MTNYLFNLNDLRMEISFKSFIELRKILEFYEKHKLFKLNIPCKNNLKKDFLLTSIKIAREEFPQMDIIPHFSIQHQFRKTSDHTMEDFLQFLKINKYLGCSDVLLVSGSQIRSTLDSLSALTMLKVTPLIEKTDFSIGVAFNPYLPDCLFENELLRLELKLKTGFVNSIWLQFGSDYILFEKRIKALFKLFSCIKKKSSRVKNINLYGSVLIPSKQFLSRFKFRPWKGVYCSDEFLESIEVANYFVSKLLMRYKTNNIIPIIETQTSSEKYLEQLNLFLKK